MVAFARESYRFGVPISRWAQFELIRPEVEAAARAVFAHLEPERRDLLVRRVSRYALRLFAYIATDGAAGIPAPQPLTLIAIWHVTDSRQRSWRPGRPR